MSETRPLDRCKPCQDRPLMKLMDQQALTNFIAGSVDGMRYQDWDTKTPKGLARYLRSMSRVTTEPIKLDILSTSGEVITPEIEVIDGTIVTLHAARFDGSTGEYILFVTNSRPRNGRLEGALSPEQLQAEIKHLEDSY